MNNYMTNLLNIHNEILNDPLNEAFLKDGQTPLYQVSPSAKILLLGQAPGQKAMSVGKAWADTSGQTLRSWLGLSEDTFYNKEIVAIVPLDFFYPGKGESGDLPPRPEFSAKYIDRILSNLPELELIVLIGNYAQKYYLKNKVKANLTLTVKAYMEYLPAIIVLPHPSPLNFRWQNKNPWFKSEVVPHLQTRVNAVLRR